MNPAQKDDDVLLFEVFACGNWTAAIEQHINGWKATLKPRTGAGRKTVYRRTWKGACQWAERALREADMQTSTRVQCIIDACVAGQTLCRNFRRRDNGETGVSYFLEPSGRVCPAAIARAAIATGKLVAQGDGLFGDDTAQTWRARA